MFLVKISPRVRLSCADANRHKRNATRANTYVCKSDRGSIWKKYWGEFDC